MLVPAIVVVAMLSAAMPVLDGRSDETLQASAEKAKASLPEALRPKFDQALFIMLTTAADASKAEDPAEAVCIARASLHGKTAEEVIRSAEAMAQRLLDDEAKRQLKVTSRALPAGKPVQTNSLACEALLSTSIAPARMRDAQAYRISETSLLKPEAELTQLYDTKRLEATSDVGTDKLAVEIEGKTLKFMTRASVESGQATAAAFQIIRNDKDVLAAVDYQSGVLGSSFSSFLLNKKNGYAVWTKSRPSFLVDEQPDTQAHYLQCH